MKYLNAQQLAFILDIKKDDARAKMCNAYTRAQGMPKVGEQNEVPKARRNKKSKKVEDPFPIAMSIEMLSKELNLPDLQAACDDIEKNYLERKATRRWVLWDYPEKIVAKAEREDKPPPYKASLPPALRSMLPKEIQEQIYKHWETAHKLIVTT